MSESQKTPGTRHIDMVAVGELLVDFISQEECKTLNDATIFQRFPGGSPANLVANMARLGKRAALIACVGNENLGKYLIHEAAKVGVLTNSIVTDPVAPTSIVMVTRTDATPDFIAYRTADRMLQPAHISDEMLSDSKIFHTTCFALSREPAQSSILDGMKRAVRAGCRISLDANYAPSIWGDRAEAQKIIREYCAENAFVKISLDDIARLFDDTAMTADVAIATFHNWGAEIVCLTLGKDGSVVSWAHGAKKVNCPTRQVKVIDATGAGDAFWAGFLTAWLDRHSPAECGLAGSNLAAMKLSTEGGLPNRIDKSRIYYGFKSS